MGRTTFRRASATLIVVALLFAACGDDDATDVGGSTDSTAVDDVDTDPTETTDPTTTTVDVDVDDDDDADEPEEPGTSIDITVEDGEVGGGGRLGVELGSTVTIRVTSDIDDHIHLHGYDVLVDVVAGEPAELTFEATIPGVFEVELEDSRIQLAELEIS